MYTVGGAAECVPSLEYFLRYFLPIPNFDHVVLNAPSLHAILGLGHGKIGGPLRVGRELKLKEVDGMMILLAIQIREPPRLGLAGPVLEYELCPAIVARHLEDAQQKSTEPVCSSNK